MKAAPVTLTPYLHHFRFLCPEIVGVPLVLVTESHSMVEVNSSFAKFDTLLQALNIHVKLIQQVEASRLRSYLVS